MAIKKGYVYPPEDRECPECHRKFKTEQGLLGHQRWVHKAGGAPRFPAAANPVPSSHSTEIMSEATSLTLVPRAYTIALTPIIFGAPLAAQREWGWREDMPLVNFLDTVIYNYFFEHGITLNSYTVEKPADIGNNKGQQGLP